MSLDDCEMIRSRMSPETCIGVVIIIMLQQIKRIHEFHEPSGIIITAAQAKFTLWLF